MLIIGFGNRARQGKDVAAESIANYYYQQRSTQAKHGLKISAPKIQKIGFADALYEMCRKEHGMSEKDPALLQRVGLEKRKEDGLYWVKRAFDKIHKDTKIVVISDLRYQNEAEYIKNQGGYCVNVTRLAPDGSQFISSDRDPNHESEVSLDKYAWDFKLVNSHNHLPLLEQQSITLTEYLRELHKI